MKSKQTSGQGKVLIVTALAVALFSLGIFVGNSISGYYAYQVETDMAGIGCLSTDDFSAATISVSDSLVYLTSGCMRMSIVTTPEQTMSIDAGIRKLESERPLAHDIMANQLQVFGIEVAMVKIHTVEDGVYYADLILKSGNKLLRMDARPSDAIAIAVRTNAPVYVSNELMDEEGFAIC